MLRSVYAFNAALFHLGVAEGFSHHGLRSGAGHCVRLWRFDLEEWGSLGIEFVFIC